MALVLPMKRRAYRVTIGWLLLVFAAGISSTQLWAQNNPVPFVDQPLVPSAVAPGGPDFTLTVNGTGFVSGATINWNGKPLATTFVSSSQLTATVPTANIATAGTASITGNNPGPGGGPSNVVFLPVANPRTFVTFVPDLIPSSVTSLCPQPGFGDFNGDGKLDIAAGTPTFPLLGDGCLSGMTVDILLGNGGGTFQSAPELPSYAIPHPFPIIVTDLNGDGKPDLVFFFGNPTSSLIVFLGNGDGTFTRLAAAPLNLSFGVDQVVTGDFAGKGSVDLAFFDGTKLDVLLGNGDGTFAGTGPVSTNVGSEGQMAVGDFNGDGKLDVAVALGGLGSITTLLGNGDGTFTISPSFPLANAGFLLAADFNGDGKLDLAVSVGAYSASIFLNVLTGNGDGTFNAGASYTTGGVQSLLAGDFDGDGRLDLALVGTCSGANMEFLHGNGDGTFQLRPAAGDAGCGYVTGVGDFNDDGKLDLNMAGNLSGVDSLAILLQRTDVALSPMNVDFPDQVVGTAGAAQTVVLSNNSNAAVTIAGITVTGDFALDPIGTTCSTSAPVTAGNNCALTVTFTPTSTGTRSGSLTVTDDAAGSPQTASLMGTGDGPDLTISMTHSGDFNQGQTGAKYLISVSNIGTLPVPSSGAPIYVTATLPAGLTATALAGVPGSGWTCVEVPLVPLTCAREDTLNAGSSYLPIMLTVDVAANAPASVTSTATVSGGGEVNTTNDTAVDLTTILQPPTADSVTPTPRTRPSAWFTRSMTQQVIKT